MSISQVLPLVFGTVVKKGVVHFAMIVAQCQYPAALHYLTTTTTMMKVVMMMLSFFFL
jgi:hypothetical protein